MELNDQQIAAAERLYARARRAFDDLVGRCRQLPARCPAQAVAALGNGIFAGAVSNDPECMVRAVQHLASVIAYAAFSAANPPPPAPINLAGYTATEGGHADE